MLGIRAGRGPHRVIGIWAVVVNAVRRRAAILAIALASTAALARQPAAALPSAPLQFGFFTMRFAADGTFTLEGQGWPAFRGTWTADGTEVTLLSTPADRGCGGPGRYRATVQGTRVGLALLADDCSPRRMILDGSSWRPLGESDPVPPRRIVRSGPGRAPALPRPAPAAGSWPSFRGPQASGVADGQHLPDGWDGPSGHNILWRTPIPGLGHSSPVVWGDRVFVTTAVSSRPGATFRPGLYGDGDASDDRSRHRWMILALDRRSGKTLWERVAHEGEPLERRHIKSTYASATPATDGRLVVAWFGSQGVHAYDVNGTFLWKVDLGRVNMGAYDIPTFEWGPASSPIIWNDLVILQCDTQADSFLLALDAATGTTVWKTERDELPSWGTPTIAATAGGPELVANASRYVRGYDPRTGREIWRLGGSSKITAPTPIFANGLFVVASGRAPERPLFAIRPGGEVVWSRTGRGSYMPTPIAYDGLLYVLGNNGVLDAYELETGKEIYRQRLPHLGSGFSASPVAADGRLYLTNEDGEILVAAAGREFRHLATNAMGELLMATPALSEGAMYVRSASSVFAIGAPRGGRTR